jgi:hypothetical protein
MRKVVAKREGSFQEVIEQNLQVPPVKEIM